jgi:aryl-alcohol dehydrogenase-like predicted oxidoreductase
MQYTKLGRTGLTVSVAGLGCGGNSRLGLGRGKSEAEAVHLVRAARDLGVTFFDTAEAYGTEQILGQAFSPAERAEVVISTKSRILKGGERMTAAEVVANLEASLRRLKTDCVDVFLLHGVAPRHYDYAREELAPALAAEQAKGKLRHLGLSETSPNDPEQTMLQRALDDPRWQVFMLAYHMLNQGARRDLFPRTEAQGVGTLMMFVVRNIFSKPGLLAETVRGLVADGKLPTELANKDNPLDFLIHSSGASSLTDAAYRFARHERGVDVVLFGTSDIGHLETNVASILAPPLPAPDLARLYELFGHLRGVGLDLPDNMPTQGKAGSA